LPELIFDLDRQVLELKVDAVRKSAGSYLSEIGSFLWFCKLFQIEPLNVTERDMCRYVLIHRNARSAEGYLTAVRWLFRACFRPVSWSGESLAQVLRGLAKGTPDLKKAPSIDWDSTRGIVRVARASRDFEQGFAYVLSSQFSLRVPSECLPLCFNSRLTHSRVFVESKDGRQFLCLDLKSRKNAPNGELLKRPCICKPGHERDVLCPVHAYYQFLADSKRDGQSGFVFSLNPTSFNRVLRIHLQRIGFADAHSATSHGFRRGTTMEILSRGGTLADILRSGGWKSSAFLEYLEKSEVNLLSVFDLMATADEAESKPAPARKRPSPGAAPPSGDIRVFFRQAP
jgi:hypothetical protein